MPTYKEMLPGGVSHTIIEIEGDDGFNDNAGRSWCRRTIIHEGDDPATISTDWRVPPDQGGVGYAPFEIWRARAGHLLLVGDGARGLRILALALDLSGVQDASTRSNEQGQVIRRRTRIGYAFVDASHRPALTDLISAFARRRRCARHSYQRLELGRPASGLAVAALLCAHFPDAEEGSCRAASLVRKETCVDIAREWVLASFPAG